MISPGTLLQNRYFVVEPIGRGGMGAVYLAVDQRLGNSVALKATLHGRDERLRASFEREARLLASLHHPALPGVMDYFVESEGQCLVMKYIPGEDLSEMLYRRGAAFSPGEALGWADQLLDALDYLHTREPGVVHRDIKPSNLKLTSRGQLILLDFGLAKDTAAQSAALRTSKTVFGYSLNYAPLEQLQGQGTGPRSDLYAFGATLYHLLTGVPPLDVLTRLDAAAGGQPDPLRRADELNAEVPPAVAAVVHRAMAVNRDQRPSSADEIRRVLRNANAALRPTFLPPYRAPRHPISHGNAFASPGVTGAIDTFGAGGADTSDPTSESRSSSPRQNERHVPSPPREARGKHAETKCATVESLPTGQWSHLDANESRRPQRTLWLAAAVIASVSFVLAAAASTAWLMGTSGKARALKSTTSTASENAAPAPEPTPAIRQPSALKGVALDALPTRGTVREVAASADGRTIAAAVEGTEVMLWRLGGEAREKVLPGHTTPGVSVAVSPDGQFVASGSEDGTVRLWQTEDGSLLRTLAEHSDHAFIVGFSQDGRRLISAGGDKTVRVIDLIDNKVLHRTTLNAEEQIVAISPDLRTIAVLGAGRKVKLVAADDGRLLRTLDGGDGGVRCGAFNAGGELLAIGNENGTVRVWQVADGGSVDARQESGESIGSVAFSPDGGLLAAGRDDGRIGVWRVHDMTPASGWNGHGEGVRSLSFGAGGKRLASGGDKSVRVWQILEE